MFEKSYEMAKHSVPAMPWDEYVRITKDEYQELLRNQSNSEEMFQEFFERNPAYLPGGFDIDDGSGHGPYLLSVVTKPSLQGIFERIPDFVWFSSYSGVFHPILIEIEAPAKRIFNQDNTTTKEFNQAVHQLRCWKIWMDEAEHKSIFMKKFRLEGTHLVHNKFLPKYLLIYGRRDEFYHDTMRKKLREESIDSNQKIRSYDGLTPSYKCRYCFIVKITENGYEAVQVSPTIELGSMNADAYAFINGKEEAVKKNKYMSDERKKFLIERFKYWDDWSKKTQKTYNTDLE